MQGMLLIKNKRAHFDYEITDTISCGVVLSGAEVKSLRAKMGSLTGSFVQIVDNKAILLNAHINPYPFADNRDYDPNRTRTLLLRRRELYALRDNAVAKNYTLVPLSFETSGKFIKLIVGVGKGRKQFEKRDKIKRRDLEREQKQSNWY